jgi:uncharacterized protein
MRIFILRRFMRLAKGSPKGLVSWGSVRFVPASVLALAFLNIVDVAFLVNHIWLLMVGMGGALIANATGVGGGIVFIPAFGYIGLPESTIVGSSLLIQSFGMTIGALTFLNLRTRRKSDVKDIDYVKILAFAVPATCVGIWAATDLGFSPNLPLQGLFRILSLGLLPFLVFTSIKGHKARGSFTLRPDDLLAMVGIGLAGGCFVGWTSIGVGELLVVYLMLRGMRSFDSVGLAVCTTAISVVAYQLTLHEALSVNYDFALTVAIGAIFGGIAAPYLVSKTNDTLMKWICGFWILASSVLSH